MIPVISGEDMKNMVKTVNQPLLIQHQQQQQMQLLFQGVQPQAQMQIPAMQNNNQLPSLYNMVLPTPML